MTTPSSTIVQRLWNYCNVLRDDGMSYGDYVEQLTYLLFLKMDQEGRAMLGKHSAIPETHNWASLKRLDGDELEKHYREILARLCVMNLYLHGIGSNGNGSGPGRSPIHVADSLASHPGEYFDMVLTNPPFGKKSSVTFVTDEGEIRREAQNILREDFWTSTSNKQLNFVQHVRNILNMNGRAAIVVPDNVLFEGGAGEVVRRKLLHECDVHTLLRLPTGIFYAQGVKANVLFFDRKPASETPWTKQLWIYDLRTNMDFTLKTNPLARANLDEFVECFHAENRFERTPGGSPSNDANARWRSFTYEELLARDKVNLDIFWLRDESLEDSANLPEPDVLATEIVEDLRAALAQFESIEEELSEE